VATRTSCWTWRLLAISM